MYPVSARPSLFFVNQIRSSKPGAGAESGAVVVIGSGAIVLLEF
jgi:hypothetical protein